MTSLDQMGKGTRARILDVEGEDAIAMRILEMGLTPGEDVILIGWAPFGDPIEFEVRGYRISLRRTEARRIQVELLPEGASQT